MKPYPSSPTRWRRPRLVLRCCTKIQCPTRMPRSATSTCPMCSPTVNGPTAMSTPACKRPRGFSNIPFVRHWDFTATSSRTPAPCKFMTAAASRSGRRTKRHSHCALVLPAMSALRKRKSKCTFFPSAAISAARLRSPRRRSATSSPRRPAKRSAWSWNTPKRLLRFRTATRR